MRWIVALAVLPACKKKEPEPVAQVAVPEASASVPTTPPPEPAPPPPGPPPAPSCLSAADCGEGEVCEGEGCGDDAPGTCMGPTRACTRDLRPYCGCTGETFLAGGNCPLRRFAHRGPCP